MPRIATITVPQSQILVIFIIIFLFLFLLEGLFILHYLLKIQLHLYCLKSDYKHGRNFRNTTINFRKDILKLISLKYIQIQ